MDSVIIKTDLPLKVFSKGKVRDTYDLGNNLLMITTDRISAFDVVLPCGIPRKGNVLNQISAFWFEKTKGIIPNHVIEVITGVKNLDKYIPAKERFAYPAYLAGRSMVVRKAKRISVECVARGYLSGSGWEEYKKSGTLFGMTVPKGLKESEILPEPMFTPTHKAESGHDLPMTMDDIKKMVGEQLAHEMRDKTIAIYKFARDYAKTRGIIIADTKFEFGLDNGNLILIDEVLTPDSSRFWDMKLYKAGQAQPSYDKQFVRDWLTASGWNHEPPAPMMPPEVCEATSKKYIEGYEKLTGKKLQ